VSDVLRMLEEKERGQTSAPVPFGIATHPAICRRTRFYFCAAFAEPRRLNEEYGENVSSNCDDMYDE
jgi:hypothetical protein